MASTISAGTTTTTALSYSADTSGVLQLQTNGGTTALTLDTSQNATFAGKVASASSLQLATNGTTTAVTIDTSQNVGIGTTSPSGTNGAGYASKLTLAGTNTALNIKSASNTDFYLGATGGSLVFYDNLNSAERARFDSSGNLLVGQTVAGGANSNSFGISPSNGYITYNHPSGTGGGAAYCAFDYNASLIGSITQNGTTGVLYNLTSDYRLKNNQEDLTGAKDFIMALKPKKWQWWDGSGEGVGFVAHEFMEVAKYSGHGEKDAVDADGKPVYQSIQPSSSEVMANLVSFIQELSAQVTTLQTQVTALKG